MICRMCLIDSPEYINIFDIEGMEMNIASIISKHFWFEPKIDDPVSNMICNACWWKIDSFHIYYTSIEEAHRKLAERFSVKNEPSLVYSYGDSDSKRFYIESVKKEENITVEFQVIDKGDLSENEDLEQSALECEEQLSQHSAEVEYVNLSPRNDEGDDLETEEALECTEHSAVEETHENLELEEESVLKEEAKEQLTPQSQEELTEKAEESNESKPVAFEKRRKRGRPKRVFPKNNKDADGNKISSEETEETNVEDKPDKSEKESEYLKKSKEDDEKIAKYMKLKCEFCAAEYITFAEVKKHYRMVHKRKGYVVCCNKKLYKRVLILDHINKHLNPDYFKCDICKKRFSDKQCLKNHMIRHESEDVKHFKCDKCPRRYAKQYLLDNHKLIHIPQEQREFFCNECGKAFPTNNLLQTHIRYVHENAYGKMCHICAKVIRGKTMFEKHQLEHAGIVEPKVQCFKCGAWLKHEYSLKKHMTRHAEETFTHVCNLCGKVAPSKGALRSHIQYVHASKRTHQCSICDKAFKKPINLKEHMTTHTGEVLYTCPHCPKTFNSSANMHSHRKKVHRLEWEESRRKRGLPQTSCESNEEQATVVYEIMDTPDDDSSSYKNKENTLCDSNTEEN